MLPKFFGLFFVLLLVIGVPALSVLTVRRAQIHLLPRRAVYFSAVVSQWLLTVLGAIALALSSLGPAGAGFRALPAASLVRWTAGLTVVSFAVLGVFLLLERFGWWPEESELVYLLIPVTRREKLWSVLVLAPTAAFCEEFLYRGYLLAQLSQWFHSAAWGLGGSSAAFGLAHTYQGIGGMVRAALLGALLAYPVMRVGSLYPSMVTHLVIDALALAWLGPKLLRRNSLSGERSE